MENTAPKCIAKAAYLVFLGVLAALICISPVSAQEQSPLPEKKANEYRSYIEKGTQYLDQGKYREAIGEFNRAMLLDPSSEEAKRGVIKANQAIAARKAVPDLGAIEGERVDYHLTKGTEYYDAEKFDEAIAEWQEALQIEPDNVLANSLIAAAKRAKVDLLIERGHDAFFSGELDEAIAIWEEARTIVPNSKVLTDLLAEAYAARHELDVGKIEAKGKVELDQMDELMRRKYLMAEGMDPDGIRRKDISERPAKRAPRGFVKQEAILKELSQPVAFEFECEPLRDVLRFLQTITGINILTDEDIFEEFGQEEDCYGNEVDRKEIFVSIHVSELPLESALSGMLRQHGLGFSIEPDFLFVSTPDYLRRSSFEQMETRFYHLKDTSRISLPKVDTQGSSGSTPSLGGRQLNLASGSSLISRLKDVTSQDVQELEGDYIQMSVPKLINILRTFVPTVLDPSKQVTKVQTRIGDDKLYGGMDDDENQIKLFEAPRALWADASGREILSLIDFDPHTNTLIVRNTPTNLDMVEVFLDHLDQEPRQIAVEARFVTYSILEAERVGVDLAFGGDTTISGQSTAELSADVVSDNATLNVGLATDILEGLTTGTALASRGGNILFRFAKTDGDFLQATINLLEEMEHTRTINAPRLITLHNKPAVIQKVNTRSFRSDLTIDQTTRVDQNGNLITDVGIDQEFTDVTEGTTLSITPQIQPDNTIRLFILPDIAEIGPNPDQFVLNTAVGGIITQNTVTRPQVARRTLFTNVVVNDGDTIVIGGFITDAASYQKTGVPFFKDIPLIGRAFENETEVFDRENLLIFITVNILDARGVAYTRLK